MAQNPPVSKEQRQPPAAEDLAAGDLAAGAPPSSSLVKTLLAKFVVLLFVVAVVVLECLVAYFCFPSASETAAMASATLTTESKEAAPDAPTKHGHKSGKEGKEGKEKKAAHPASGQVEVDLGEYSVTAAHPTANATLQISFHLYGTVAAAEEEEFQTLKKENEHRFREQVLVTVRGAKIADLTDAGLGLLKRSILEKTNGVLGRPILQMVIFSDFVFIEQ